MRNDAYDADPDNVPSLTAKREHDEPYPEPDLQPLPQPPREARSSVRARRRGVAGAVLWVLVLALLIALGGLAWWAHRQIIQLEAQLVATQESFARVSEDAAGRLSDIRGQVVATESNVTTESEALKLRLKQLERQVAELVTQQQLFSSQQRTLEDQQSGQAGRLEKQDARLFELAREQQARAAELKTLDERTKRLAERDDALASAQTALQGQLEQQAKLTAGLAGLREDVSALQKRGDGSQALQRLEQDLLVLRSQVDNRPATSAASTAEFDAFRAQMTRSINTLQSQIAHLQAQLDAR